MTSQTLSRPALVALSLGIQLACAPACSRSSVVPPPPMSSAPPTVVDVTDVADLRREDTFVTPSGVDAWVKALPVTVEQGPLRTCADMKWQLFADVRITGEPRARETVVELDAARTATPFDCKQSYSGERLVEPCPGSLRQK